MNTTVEVLVESPGWSALDLEALAGRAAREALAHLDVAEADLAILACDDARIAALNTAFRGLARPTNVLSWPSEELGATREGGWPAPPGDTELGDIAIAWETCSAEARAAGVPIADHVTHLIVHAVLHLLGYDHSRDGDAVLMERLEVEILGKMGLPDPYRR